VTDYELQPNESVIMKSEDVTYGRHSGDLILTNLNIIWVRRGATGKAKGVQQFPVQQIKIFAGKAQAFLQKTFGEYPKLEVNFISGQESFEFQSKKEVEQWIHNINQMATGQTEFDASASTVIPGTEIVTETLETVKGTVDAFKGALGIKSKSELATETAKDIAGTVGAFFGAKGNEAPTESPVPYTEQTQQKAPMSFDEQIATVKKLKDLLDAGILSQEEFDAKKRDVMGL